MVSFRDFRARLIVLAVAIPSFLAVSPAGGNRCSVDPGPSGRLALVTYVLNPDQERKAEVLIKSLRRFGGAYSGIPVYVVLGNPQDLPCPRLRQAGVELVPTDADETARRYPLAIKAYAAAQIERLVADRVDTLAWFDPETLVIGPLPALDLGKNFDTAVRPVFKVNNVGLAADAPPDVFWGPIYRATGLNPAKIPVVETLLEEQSIKAYYNCEIFSVRPRVGIFRRWAACLETFLKDPEFQRTACPDSLHRLFLHQAVLSAVVVSKTSASRRRDLPDSCGYPLNLHQNLPPARKAAAINGLSAVILETVWDDQPGWMKMMESREPLKSWLRQAFTDYKMVVPGIYREERAQGCNSYLFTAGQGSVLVDAGGTDDPDSWLLEMAKAHPVQAVLLTHGHKDHLAGLGRWIEGKTIPVVAQREQPDFLQYQDRLAGFYARRNAV
ncbi:MAG: MBL fold metallo-hydrolase, partial [Candidatus Aminicenantes bacterium]|nr:MBL fold metallo-hydrolase [Candidatus Aminicenantes bacterium]